MTDEKEELVITRKIKSLVLEETSTPDSQNHPQRKRRKRRNTTQSHPSSDNTTPERDTNDTPKTLEDDLIMEDESYFNELSFLLQRQVWVEKNPPVMHMPYIM